MCKPTDSMIPSDRDDTHSIHSSCVLWTLRIDSVPAAFQFLERLQFVKGGVLDVPTVSNSSPISEGIYSMVHAINKLEVIKELASVQLTPNPTKD